MFTRQRRNYRIFVYAALIVTLCILVAALMWPKDSAPAGSDEIKSQNEANADSQAGDQDGYDNNGGSGQNAGSDDDNDGKNNDGSQSASKDDDGDQDQNDQDKDDDKPVVSGAKDTYYVVKRDGDRISVFFSDENGREIELESTDIIYELLTPEDQKKFDEGIKAESQEQLSSLLQDFES